MTFLDRIATQGARMMAFGLGVLALLLDFTGWFIIAGAVVALQPHSLSPLWSI